MSRPAAAGGAAALLLALLGACGGPPPLRVATPAEAASARAACDARFPAGAWSVVHAIDARLPLGLRTAFLGVASWRPEPRSLRVLGLALEGVTLVDLEVRSGRVTARRTIPPLDRPGFAAGLAADVQTLLLRPAAVSVVVGVRPDGQRVCRYRDGEGRTVDVTADPGERWALRQYDARGRLRRTVEARGAAPGRFAREMRLVAPGALGYRMTLTLIRTEAEAGARPAPPEPRPPAGTAPPPPAPAPGATPPGPAPRR